MAVKLRIATFNLENLDDKQGQKPTLEERALLMRPQLARLDADVLCLQEVNGQESAGQPRRLLALDKLLAGTRYTDYHRVHTTVAGGEPFDERNLVVLSHHEILEHRQHKHDFTPAPLYRKVTAVPPEQAAQEVTWERPILHARLGLGGGRTLDVVNVHLKSRIPTPVQGQQADRFTWRTSSGWAEGFFLSSMKRVGQALEARMLLDSLFQANPDALVVVCGDFNAESDDVAVEAIRGDVENTGNPALARRVLVACERTIPESSRYSLLHLGKGRMLDHLLASRSLLTFYRGAEIHNELLHDESAVGASDKVFPESDHAPVVAEFELPED